MMKALLEMWNYEVVLAGEADDGLHLAKSQHFDLYLLDTHLPDESGFELCKQICGVPGHAPVVFISTVPYETDKQRGWQAGAIAYLTKPLDFDVLEITLTRLITQAPGRGLENTMDSRQVDSHCLTLSRDPQFDDLVTSARPRFRARSVYDRDPASDVTDQVPSL